MVAVLFLWKMNADLVFEFDFNNRVSIMITSREGRKIMKDRPFLDKSNKPTAQTIQAAVGSACACYKPERYTKKRNVHL